jgi:CBS domain-containing protein
MHAHDGRLFVREEGRRTGGRPNPGEQTLRMPIRVHEYMTRDVVTIPSSMEIMQLVHLLVERDISGAVVVDSNGNLAGIVTERDCIEVAAQAGYFDELGGTVAEFMTTAVETVGPDETLMDVAQRMGSSAHRRFPVIEHGRVVGLISRRDVLRALLSGAWFTHPDQSG